MSIDRTLMEYRLGVGIILINSENKVFVGQRLDQGSGIEACLLYTSLFYTN